VVVRTKAGRALLNGKRQAKLEPDLQRIAELKALIENLGAELDELTERVLPGVKALGKTVVTPDGTVYTGVWPKRTYYDDAGIRKAIGEENWAKVRKESFDPKAAEALVLAGVIAIEVISEHAEVQPTKPYVLVTRPTA
jgi:hypothetical protein